MISLLGPVLTTKPSTSSGISKQLVPFLLFLILEILTHFQVQSKIGNTYGIKIYVYPNSRDRIDVVCGSDGYKPYYYQTFYANGILEWTFEASELDEGWYCQAHMHQGCLRKWHEMQDPPGASPSLPWCEPFVVYGSWFFNSTIGESVPSGNNVWVIDNLGKRLVQVDNEETVDFETDWDFRIHYWVPLITTTARPSVGQLQELEAEDPDYFNSILRVDKEAEDPHKANGNLQLLSEGSIPKWPYPEADYSQIIYKR